MTLSRLPLVELFDFIVSGAPGAMEELERRARQWGEEEFEPAGELAEMAAAITESVALTAQTFTRTVEKDWQQLDAPKRQSRSQNFELRMRDTAINILTMRLAAPLAAEDIDAAGVLAILLLPTARNGAAGVIGNSQPDEVQFIAGGVIVEFLSQWAKYHREGKIENTAIGLVRIIARRRAMDALGKRWHTEPLSGKELAPEPEEAEDKTADIARMNDCIEKLPPGKKAIVWSFYVEERSWADIAATCGRNEGAVRVEMHRLKEALKKCIENKKKENGV